MEVFSYDNELRIAFIFLKSASLMALCFKIVEFRKTKNGHELIICKEGRIKHLFIFLFYEIYIWIGELNCWNIPKYVKHDHKCMNL